MADDADEYDADEYNADEYEPESPVNGSTSGAAEMSPSPVAPCSSSPEPPSGDVGGGGVSNSAESTSSHYPPPAQAVSTRQEQHGRLVDDSASDADTDADPRARRSTTTGASPARRATGRHLLDNTVWTYSIEATRVRALKIPIVDSAVLRELRVFAVLDKQARQSRGSLWKTDATRNSRRPSLLSTGSSRSIATAPSSTGRVNQRSSSSSPSRRQPVLTGRRSGLLEEAKWSAGDGALTWVFPMERFRHLKAYCPRIKVFLYGVEVGDTVGAASNRSPKRTGESETADIVGLGWFFLDLRTPDLPARWLKLQNARYGGEVEIRSSLSPFASSAPASPLSATSIKMQTSTRERGKLAVLRSPEAATSSRSTSDPAPPHLLVPQEIITDDAGDFLQLGTRNGTDVFVVSVVISGARDLATLVRRVLTVSDDPTEVSTATSAGFWFSYSLFDVVVQTDVFHNLEAAEFPPIRDSFRVRSCLDDLRAFIDASHGGLPVFLCTKNRIVSGVTIPLSELLDGDLFAQDKQTPLAGTSAQTKERFSFPECEAANVSASVSIEFVGPAVGRLGPSSKSIDTHEDNTMQISAESQAATIVETAPITIFRASVTHIRLSNALLSPLVGSDSVTASLDFVDSHAVELLEFCCFEKEFTTARLRQSSVTREIGTSDRSTAKLAIHISATASKRFLGEAIMNVSEMIDSGAALRDKAYSVPFRDEAGELVGECAVRLTVSVGRQGESAAQASDDEERKVDDRGEQRRLYRLSLQVKAVRDVATAGTYTIAFEHPFHKGIRVQSQPLAVPAKRETSVRNLAYCVSERLATLSEIKQLMDGTVVVDLSPIGGRQNSEDGGIAAFSLNYLFYSEERYSCPAPNCRSTFPTDEDAEAHLREDHGDDENAQSNASTSIKSCSIYVPIVRAVKQQQQQQQQQQRDNRLSDTRERNQRVGMVRIEAALEDFGPSQPTRSDGTLPLRLVPEPRVFSRSRAESLKHQSPRLDRSLPTEKQRVSTSDTAETAEVHRRSDSAPDSSPRRVRAPPTLPTAEMLSERVVEQEQEELARQVREWKVQFAEAERVRMDELEHEWARREEERAELLRAAQREYERLELKLRDALADVESRERRLSIAEDALEREQRAHRDEMEALRKRLASDQSHAVSLATQQREAFAQRVTQLEAQLAEAQQRAKEVERDYAEYRQQQRKVPEARLREEIAALRGNISELERQKLAEERARLETADTAAHLRMQLESANLQVQEERKKHETHVVEELEKLRLKYIAREEKYVLDGDRHELQAIKRQLDELRGIHERTGASASGSGFVANSDVAGRMAGRQKRSAVMGSRSSQKRQQPRRATQTYQHQEPRSGDDGGERMEYRESPSSDHRLRDQGEDQRSERSSEASDYWDGALDLDGRRKGTRPSRDGFRRRARVRSSSSVSDAPSFDDAGLSDAAEFNDEVVESFSPSQSENDAPVHRQSVLSAFTAGSIATAGTTIASNGIGAGAGSAGQELKRLQRERELLLSSGAYNSRSYLVRELDRLIAATRGKMRL